MNKIKKISSSLLAVLIAVGFSLSGVPIASATHNNGCLVLHSGTVWKIENGSRRGFTSAEVFMSHGYNFSQVVSADSGDVNLPMGPIMTYADGTLVKGPSDPLVYLVVNGQKRGFTSGSVFTGLGYSWASIQWAPVNTFSDLPTGANIDSTTITGLPHSGPGPQYVSCSTVNDDNDNGDPTLRGGAGSVDEYSLVSGLSNEEVGEGQEDVDVAGLRIEVDEGSDIRLTSVRLVFDEGNADRRFNRYATEVSLWLDGDEVGRVDADEFTNNNNWTKSVSLDSSAIIRRGQTGEFMVAVSGVNTLDSADEDETWTVDFRQIRFIDADGASTSEDPNTATRTFSFVSFANASDVELKLSLNDDDDEINEAHIIDIDDNDDTDNVELLSFVIEAQGDSDLTINEIPVLITTTEAAGTHFDDPDDVITEASLWMNGQRIATESLSTGDANDDSDLVVFEDLDINIDSGDEAEFMVKVDLVSTDDDLDNGDTVRAQITATERDDIDVEDEEGNDVDNRTGTASAEASAVYDEGIMVEFVSASETKSFSADETGESDRAEFKITFEVTAFDGDMRLDRSCEDEAVDGIGDAGEGVVFSVSDASATVISCLLSSSKSDSEDNGSVFEIDENTTRKFTLTVNVEGDGDFVELMLESINWGTAQNNSNANSYIFNLGDFKTGSIFLNSL